MPVTTPEISPTEAMAGFWLLHMPPGMASLKVVVLPMQMDVAPVIAGGLGLTVIGIVVSQPVGNVKVTVASPADIPVTTPVV
jgi:hypothetical protein